MVHAVARAATAYGRRSRWTAHLAAGAALLLVGGVLSVPPATAAPAASRSTGGAGAAAAPMSIVPAGFADTVAISGLTQPTDVAFAADGRVFIGEKSGLIKVFDSLSDTTPTVFADMRTQVHNFWDRGLLGITLDPGFPAKPYVYALYTYDAVPGGTAPRWGTVGATSDGCPNPPGATGEGCVVQARLSRLTASGDRMSGEENVLVAGWCQQFPSHTIGTVAFGPDGALYASAGEGANFNYVDYGQTKNPCGDPPSPAGTGLTPPSAQGGALRAQSARRPAGQAATLDGTIVRVDPMTGAGLLGNPFASSADPNARRIIAYGLRNPFRFDLRPGTQQLWVGDVGWNTWEEINRIADVDDGVAENFGWPCYEGASRHPSYDAANLNSCESLYTGAAQTAPFHSYRHDMKVSADDPCSTGSSAISGIAFEDASNYPAEYDGALFFSDAARGCIWVMRRGGGANPTPTLLSTFVGGAGQVVQVAMGPGGDLFYLDLAGALHRVVYTGGNRIPTAVVTAQPTSGPAPLTVQFDGRGSQDLDGDPLTFAWDLDGDGAYDDSADPAPRHTYSAGGTVTAGLRVTDDAGASDTESVTISVGPPNSPPVPVIDTPAASFAWKVGDDISFSGHATDAQEGTLAASRLSWSVVLNHCPSNCHTHPLQDLAGVASGSFPAPDHEYPSSLTLVLTATDAAGATASTSVELDPRTVDLTFATEPLGLQLGVGAATATAPFTRTVIVGSTNSLSAPSPQTLDGERYVFGQWSDGGAATHNVVAPATPATYTAAFATAHAGCPATPSYAYTIPTPTGPPAATSLADGRTAFGAVGSDGHLALAAADISGDPLAVGPLQCAGGIATDTPALAAGSSFAALFVRTADNRLWQRTLTSGSQGSWTTLPIGGASANGPSAVVTVGDVVHLVVRGTDGRIYHATRRSTTWSRWDNLGGAVQGTPAVAPRFGGGIAIFVRGTDNLIWTRGGDTGLWTSWSSLGGATLSNPTVAWGYAPNQLHVFVAGTSGGLYQRDLKSGTWTRWYGIDGTLPATARLAAAGRSGRVVVYASGAGGINYKQYVGGWTSFRPAPYACATCQPAATLTSKVP
jgi:glucose/arabinose dehydrogenase